MRQLLGSPCDLLNEAVNTSCTEMCMKDTQTAIGYGDGQQQAIVIDRGKHHHTITQHWHQQKESAYSTGWDIKGNLRLVTVQSVWSIRLKKSNSSNLSLVYGDLYRARDQ